MSPTSIALVLLVLLNAGCQKPQKSHYALGAHECSMIPEEYVCRCDGKERPATRDEKLAVYCGAVYTMCEGEVSDCKIAVQSGLPFTHEAIDAGPQGAFCDARALVSTP